MASARLLPACGWSGGRLDAFSYLPSLTAPQSGHGRAGRDVSRYAAVKALTGALLIGLGGTALAGCDDGEAGATPTSSTPGSSGSSTAPTSGTSPSTTRSATSSTTAVPVSIPPEARKKTEKGAEAFAKYFVQLLNEAQTQAQSSTLASISDEGCRGCEVYME